MPNKYLFVYGTLMSAFNYDASIHLRECASLIGIATTEGQLYLVKWSFEYPAMVKSSASKVSGELYEVQDQNVFDFLDQFEGSEYDKVLQEVDCDGEVYQAQCYLFNGDVSGLGRIESNDFLNRKGC